MKTHVPLDMAQMTTPPSPFIPVAGRSLLYPKSDGRWYTEDSNGIETPLGSGGYPPYANGIQLGAGNFAVNTNAATNYGATITVTSMGPDDVFLCSYDIVVFVPSAFVTFASFSIDGGQWAGDQITTYFGGITGGGYGTMSRTARITGLSAGVHTIGVRGWNNTTSVTATWIGACSTLMVARLTGSGGSGVPDWRTMGMAAVSLTLPATPTLVPFTVDLGGNGVTADGSGRLVVNKAGVYHVVVTMSTGQLGATNNGYVRAVINQRRGGSTIATRGTYVSTNVGNTYDDVVIQGDFDAQVGDQFEVTAFGSIASNNNIIATDAQFTAHRLVGDLGNPSVPLGTIGYVQSATQQSGLTTQVDLTGLSITANLFAGRRYRMSYYGLWQAGGASAIMAAFLYVDATSIQECNEQAGPNEYRTLNGQAVFTTTTGSHTVKVRGGGGIASVSHVPGSTRPSWLLLEDIGV